MDLRPVVVCLAVVASGCDVKVGEQGGVSVDMARGRATDEWKRSYTIPASGRLEVINVNGLIEAFPATGPQAEVVARREASAPSDEAAREQLAKTEIVETVTSGHVRVEFKPLGESGSFMGRRSRVNVQYRVAVPPGLNVSLRTENGVVRLENIQGTITAASTNGPVFGRGVSGSIDASTVNGGIEMELVSVNGESKIVTVNGPVSLALGKDVNAQLEASAVNGGVVVHESLSLTADEKSQRRISGRINDGGPRIVVQTTNGGVRVTTSQGMTRGFGRGRRGRGPAGG
jgi:hypothetical protein